MRLSSGLAMGVSALKLRQRRASLQHLPNGLSKRLLWLIDPTDRSTVFGSNGTSPVYNSSSSCGKVLDKVGGSHLVQSTGANQAIWTADAGNGIPGLVFSGSSYYDLATDFTPPAAPFIVVAIVQLTDNADYKVLMSGATASFDLRWDSAEKLDPTMENQVDMGAASTATPVNAPCLNVLYYQGTQTLYRVNGASVGTGAATSISAATKMVGQYYSAGPNGHPFSSTLYTLAVFDATTSWSNEEIAILESYLRS